MLRALAETTAVGCARIPGLALPMLCCGEIGAARAPRKQPGSASVVVSEPPGSRTKSTSAIYWSRCQASRSASLSR